MHGNHLFSLSSSVWCTWKSQRITLSLKTAFVCPLLFISIYVRVNIPHCFESRHFYLPFNQQTRQLAFINAFVFTRNYCIYIRIGWNDLKAESLYRKVIWIWFWISIEIHRIGKTSQWMDFCGTISRSKKPFRGEHLDDGSVFCFIYDAIASVYWFNFLISNLCIVNILEIDKKVKVEKQHDIMVVKARQTHNLIWAPNFIKWLVS